MTKLKPKECYSRWGKAWYKANKETISKYYKARNRQLKLEVIRAFGGACACCGETEPAFLSIDHINGRGDKKDRVSRFTGLKLYKWLADNGFPKDNLQLLCHNCNQGRQLNGGICPHQV